MLLIVGSNLTAQVFRLINRRVGFFSPEGTRFASTWKLLSDCSVLFMELHDLWVR